MSHFFGSPLAMILLTFQHVKSLERRMKDLLRVLLVLVIGSFRECYAEDYYSVLFLIGENNIKKRGEAMELKKLNVMANK